MARILVIEDDEEILSLMTEIASFEEHEVISAECGLIGLQLAQEHIPDMIICDLCLPGLSGYEVIRSLKQDSKTQAIPFVFVSAQAQTKQIQEGLELGAKAYITKPFGIEDFLTVISTHLTPKA